MKKVLLMLVVLIASCFIFSGCGKEQEKKELSIDFDKCKDDCIEDLNIEENYSFVQDINIELKDNINITVVVEDSTDPSVALDFADTVVRRLNLFAKMQDDSIEPSSNDYYGGLYDCYDALIGVAQLSKIKNSDEWLIFDAITSGNGPAIELQK